VSSVARKPHDLSAASMLRPLPGRYSNVGSAAAAAVASFFISICWSFNCVNCCSSDLMRSSMSSAQTHVADKHKAANANAALAIETTILFINLPPPKFLSLLGDSGSFKATPMPSGVSKTKTNVVERLKYSSTSERARCGGVDCYQPAHENNCCEVFLHKNKKRGTQKTLATNCREKSSEVTAEAESRFISAIMQSPHDWRARDERRSGVGRRSPDSGRVL